MNRPARPQVKATVGGNAPSQLGMDALLDFRMEVTLDGKSLSAAEIKHLLAHSDGLVLIRGKWVEVDRERLSWALAQFEAIERRAAELIFRIIPDAAARVAAFESGEVLLLIEILFRYFPHPGEAVIRRLHGPFGISLSEIFRTYDHSFASLWASL